MNVAFRFIPTRLGAGIALSLALTACHPTESSSVDSSPEVSTEYVVFRADSPQLQVFRSTTVDAESRPRISLSGRLNWDETRTAYLHALAAGQVSSIEVELGDQVERGQVLAWISAPDIGGLQADHARSRAEFRQARLALERARELHVAGVASGREVEEAEAAAVSAEAEYGRTLAGIETVGAARRVDQRLPLRAPIAGVVVEHRLSPGMSVGPDNETPLVVISDPDRLWLQIDIPEHRAAGIEPGLAVEVEGQGQRQDTVLKHVAEFIDSERHTIPARAEIDNTGRQFKAGQSVRSMIELSGDHGVQIPARGLLQTGDQQVVFVEEAPGRFRRQPVQAQRVSGSTARITQGLDTHARIVVEGSLLLLQLTDQALVNVGQPDAGVRSAP